MICVPDASDVCPALAEDFDLVASADGCPDTNAAVAVVTEQAFAVNAGDAVTKPITITLTNGNYPADIRVTVLAVSDIGFCEARIQPEPGDLAMDFVTDENGDMVVETLYSHVEWVEAVVPANSTRTLSRDYVVECMEPGTFIDAYELQVDVLPLHPVQEEDLSDNVRKNFPDVTVAGAAVDSDGDGFGDGVETFVGALAAVPCASDPAPNNEPSPDAWPVDVNDNQLANTVDVGFFLARLNAAEGELLYAPRYDLNHNGVINTNDIGRFVPFLNEECASG